MRFTPPIIAALATLALAGCGGGSNSPRAVPGAVAGGLATGRALALPPTPATPEGDFYPEVPPADTDADLTRVAGAGGRAVGTVVRLGGRVRDVDGYPIRNAVVELWQADAHGAYLHPAGQGTRPRDPLFQGYGRCVTSKAGVWAFTTVKPGPRPGRARHFCLAVQLPGRDRRFRTHVFWDDAEALRLDPVWRALPDDAARVALVREFSPVTDTDEWQATWDIVVP